MKLSRLKRFFFIVIQISFIFSFGRWRLLFNIKKLDIIFIFLSIPLAHLLFFFCLLINRFSFREAVKYTFPISAILSFYRKNRKLVLHYSLTSLREELFWRATIQYLLSNSAFGISITALFFTLIHIQKLNTTLIEIAEFMIFSFILGITFWKYENLYFVTIIHMIRNVNLSYYYKKRK